MGGLSGHMKHIWDDLSLSAQDVSQICHGVVDGVIPLREKVDGYNIHFFIDRTGVKFARNPSDLAAGGFKDCTVRFAHNPGAGEVFKQAYNTLSGCAQINDYCPHTRSISSTYHPLYIHTVNSEVVRAGKTNTLSYDKDVIVFHDVWAWKWNGEKYEHISTVSFGESGYTYSLCDGIITRTPWYRHNGLTSFNIDDELKKIFGTCSSIDDLCTQYFYNLLAREHPEIASHPELSQLLYARLAGEKIPLARIRSVARGIRDAAEFYKTEIDDVLRAPYLRIVLFPLQKFIVQLGCELISATSEPIYILPPNWEEIASQPDITLLQVCHVCQCSKEGYVFTYGNNTYKLTGTFGAINRIMHKFENFEEQ